MKESRNKVLSIISIMLILSSICFAGTTGKIAGKVVDKDTGEPLFGVNVIIMGTNLGAATDFEGDFVILNIPPGVHNLKVSMISYSAQTLNNVRVKIDQTTPLSVQLSSNIIETDEVIVVAERNVIKQDVSTSVISVEPEEIQFLPVSSVNDVIELQAGVEDGLVVRGGGADELLFQIDGITLRDPRNNQPISSVALTSIQEVSIEKGGFNAEYGQVRSGIVNIVSKEGSRSEYHGAVQVKYAPAQKKHFGISVYDPNSMWNRSYLDPAVAWTGTQNGVWDEYDQRQSPQFEGWNNISNALLSDNDPTNDLTPAGAKALWEWQHRRRAPKEADYIFDASFGGPVPVIGKDLGNLRFFGSFRYEKEMLLIPLSRDDYQEYFGSIKLTSNLSKGMKLMLSGNSGKSYNVAQNTNDAQFNNLSFGISGQQFWNSSDFMRTPLQIASITNEQRSGRIFTPSWYSHSEVNHISLAGKLSHFINSNSFYEVSVEYLNRQFETGPLAQRDLTQRYEIVPGYFVDEAPFGFDKNPNTGIAEPGFFFGGHSSTLRDSSSNTSFSMNANLTSQVTKEHLIKAGVQFSYYDLNLKYGEVNEFFSTRNYVDEVWNPYRFSAFVQDKIEMLGFVANLGVRMDLSNPNTVWDSVDPFNPYFSSNPAASTDVETVDSKVDLTFSPRVGISHPITDVSKLYFNYGHFKQMPAYEEIYRIGRANSGQIQNYGDPNLIQAKTVSYELGYDHAIFEEYLIQLAAFYNDISDQQSYTQYVSNTVGYFRTNSNSYADTRGLELTLKKTHGNWIRGFVNYTYQVNTSGAFGRRVVYEDRGEQKLYDQTTSNFYQDRPVPQPRANATITFFTPYDYGMLLGDWSANLLANWRAGEYLTYNPKNVYGLENNVQVADFVNVDLKINKTFEFDFLKVMFFMEIRNLFNNKTLSGASFYDSFDQSFYFESLHLSSDEGYDNIAGDDRIGDYRKAGVDFQPIEQVGQIGDLSPQDVNQRVIFYDKSTQKYMNVVDDNWVEVESSKMDKIKDDKAYIDMPNNSSFDFLNPRLFYFGINFSFTL